MESLLPLLAEHPFFEGMPEEYLQLVSGCAANVHLNPNEALFREDEEAEHLHVIRHGKVRLEIAAPPRDPVVIDTVDAGEVLGRSWLFPPYRWHFDAIASEDMRATIVDGACLLAKCEGDHDLGFELAKRFFNLVQDRLQATRLRLLDMYGNPTSMA